MAAMLVTGCGDDGLAPTSETDPGDDTGTPSSTVVRVGSGTGASFSEGTLEIGVTGTLAAGGSASVTARLVDDNANPVETEIEVFFSSTCSSGGQATLESPITATNGVARSTYVALGCAGTDTITARAVTDNGTVTATGTITVAAAALGGIEFVSATPELIALKGTGAVGLQETSTVVFRVFNEAGGSVPGATVDFALSTDVGGITLRPSSAISDANGQVQTVIQSGDVAAVVAVTATVTSTAISVQSSRLSISTGLPDQDSFTVGASILNPEALGYAGVVSEITARLADRFNNPVPDGTAVNFRTEGGSIVGSCTTTDGSCTVDWVSQNPKPADGRSTILAFAIGEESFTDTNGDGRFGDGETFSDIGEAFLDENFDGIRDVSEPFVDFDNDAVYDDVNSSFEGILCDHSTDCSTAKSLNVFDQIELVMSSSGANITIPGPISVAAGPVTVTITVADVNGNVMPMDTTIEVDAGKYTIIGPSSFKVPNTTQTGLGATQFQVTIADPDPVVDDAAGKLSVVVTTPKEVGSTNSVSIDD